MQNHTKSMIIAVVFAAAIATPTIRSQDLNNKSSDTKRDRKDLPIVDFSGVNDSSIGRARGNRYDVKSRESDAERFVLKESDPEELYELTPSHAPAKPAIPVAEGDEVIIGEVIDTQAHLSNDKTSVYSAFSVRVEEVWKNTSKLNLNIGSVITAERRGGGVRFSSGKILLRGNIRETMPLVGGRYLLFLRSPDESQSSSVITGYELRVGRVFPLDGIEVPDGTSKSPQFAAYDGVEQGDFLNEVRNALVNPR
jgi:hypothetical protein